MNDEHPVGRPKPDTHAEAEVPSREELVAWEIYDRINKLTAQLQKHPSDRNLKAILAAALAGHGRADEALAIARTFVEENEHDAWAWEQLAKYYGSCNRIEEARNAFYRAIRLDEGWADPWVNLGTLLADYGELEQALHCYRKASELDPRGKEHPAQYQDRGAGTRAQRGLRVTAQVPSPGFRNPFGVHCCQHREA